MRTRLIVVVGLALALLALGGVLISPHGPAAAPNQSTVDRPADAIAAAQARLARVPADWVGWAELGMAYVQRARVTADPTDYPRAEQALGRSMAVHPDSNAPALTGFGALAAARHDFTAALHYGQMATAANPYGAAGYGVLVDALVELGRYDEAEAAAQHMLDLRPDTGSYARASYLFELRGAVPAATEMMRLTLADAATPADAAFAHQHLAALAFDAGDLAGASAEVSQGLQALPGYPPLRAMRARVLAAQGDLAGAVQELQPVVDALPTVEYTAMLAELLDVLGDRSGAAEQRALLRLSADLLAANGVAVDLELSLVDADRALLDHTPPPSLTAARAGYAARPSVTSADALGWALYAAGRTTEALSYADRALRLGTRSAAMLYHRGMIRLALGDRTGARQDLAGALAINPFFSVRHAAIARRALGGLS
ncbi:MAG TPA: tetratricopeptide repeat protein [Micromonosporaceae bacterium]|jgi:tetratricopeptide (TPR) repeat protein|nr:tetratricopeptide repeat protein [Micromonosporaceae bacterium]